MAANYKLFLLVIISSAFLLAMENQDVELDDPLSEVDAKLRTIIHFKKYDGAHWRNRAVLLQGGHREALREAVSSKFGFGELNSYDVTSFTFHSLIFRDAKGVVRTYESDKEEVRYIEIDLIPERCTLLYEIPIKRKWGTELRYNINSQCKTLIIKEEGEKDIYWDHDEMIKLYQSLMKSKTKSAAKRGNS